MSTAAMTRTRHPIASPALATTIGLALACVLFFGLSGCGGGDQEDDPAQRCPSVGERADEGHGICPLPVSGTSSTGTAGNDTTGTQLLVLTLPGPVLDLATATTVTVHISGSATQRLHYAAHVGIGLQLSQPITTGFSSASADAQGVARLAYQVQLALPAGRTELQAQLISRATDSAGLATGALAQLQAQLEWTVTQP